MTMDELTQLETQQAAALQKTRRQIEDRETEIRLPALRKKYEGKYFKYLNSSGPGRTWPVYVYCRCVTGLRSHMALMDTFQTAPHRCEFEQNKEEGEYLLQTQITKREWNRALRAFKVRVERLGKKP